MRNVSGVRCAGPLEPYAAGFAAELSRLGYTPGSAQHELRLMAHLSGWLGCEGLGLAQLTTPVVEAFLGAAAPSIPRRCGPAQSRVGDDTPTRTSRSHPSIMRSWASCLARRVAEQPH